MPLGPWVPGCPGNTTRKYDSTRLCIVQALESVSAFHCWWHFYLASLIYTIACFSLFTRFGCPIQQAPQRLNIFPLSSMFIPASTSTSNHLSTWTLPNTLLPYDLDFTSASWWTWTLHHSSHRIGVVNGIFFGQPQLFPMICIILVSPCHLL